MMIADIRADYKSTVRAQILKTARVLFVHQGYRAFSLRALARRIGYSPAAVYKHFKSKQHIFDLLAQESFDALAQASANVKTVTGEAPVKRLKRGLLAYVEFGLQNPDHFRFAFLVDRPAARTKPQSAYEALRHRVRECIASSVLRAGNVELMAQSLWAAAHGITSLLIQKPAFPWAARNKLVRQVVDSAIAGLLASKKSRIRRGAIHGNRHNRS